MAESVVTDGMVLDHVAEFLYYPRHRLEALYAADRSGYVDAIVKFVQLVVTADRLAMSPNPTNSEMGRLKEELGDTVDPSPISFTQVDRGVRTAESLDWLRSSAPDKPERTRWERIDAALATDEGTALALAGHVKREFERCFVLRREKMASYVGQADAQALSSRNIRELVRAVESLPSFRAAGVSQDDLVLWLSRTVTTHYRNFGEYMCFCQHHYIPAGTRSRLSLDPSPESGGIMHTVTRCIAIDVLKSALKRGGRRALAQLTLEWRISRKADQVRAGLTELVNTFDGNLASTERERVMRYVNKILEEGSEDLAGCSLHLALGTGYVTQGLVEHGVMKPIVTALGIAHIGKAVAEYAANKVPRPLRWLYAIRQPSAALVLPSLVDQLI